MIRGKEKVESQERLDQIGAKVLRSLKVSEEEIEAVAGSPDLYDRLRSRIEAGPKQECGKEAPAAGRLMRVGRVRRFIPIPPRAHRSLLWALAAAAAVLLLAAAILPWRPRTSIEPSQLIESASPRSPSASTHEIAPNTPPAPTQAEVAHLTVRGASQVRSAATFPHRRVRSRSSEIATDFFPLTFIADSTALESGQVVRVRIPRSALVSFGVPMNVERAGELVKADVVIGDDGLARAIRFIQ